MTLAQLRWLTPLNPGVPLVIDVPGGGLWLLVDPPCGEQSLYRLEREWTP